MKTKDLKKGTVLRLKFSKSIYFLLENCNEACATCFMINLYSKTFYIKNCFLGKPYENIEKYWELLCE